jgi:hypothetical protein
MRRRPLSIARPSPQPSPRKKEGTGAASTAMLATKSPPHGRSGYLYFFKGTALLPADFFPGAPDADAGPLDGPDLGMGAYSAGFVTF